MTNIKVVNTYTGEELEFKYSNAIELQEIYALAKASEDAIKRARVKIALAMDKILGDEEELDLGNGYKFKRIQGFTKKFPRSVVAEYLDEDQMDLVTDINGKKLKDLLAELVKEGVAPKGAWIAIEAVAEVKAKKAYVKPEKV